MDERLIDFGNPRERALFISETNRLTGLHRVTIIKYRKRRSDQQNKYYWSCFIAPFGQFLRDQGNDITDLEAHDALKLMFLRKTCINKNTGEAIDYVRGSSKINTFEFYEYLERVAAFLAEQCDIIVPEAALVRPSDEVEAANGH